MPVSRWLGLLGLVAAAVPVSGCGGAPAAAPHIPARIHKIRHVIVVMQENRSFDSYFGTYPGADGLPAGMRHGAGCNPDPTAGAACGRSTTAARSTWAGRTRRRPRYPTSTAAA